MSNLSIFIGVPIGLFGFLFLVWRRLREDYTSDRIFSLGLIMCGGILLGLVAGLLLQSKIMKSVFFNPTGLWFWFSSIFLFFAFIYSFRKFKLRFFEVLESVAVGYLFFNLAIFITDFFVGLNVRSLAFSVFTLFLILVFYFLKTRYKRFSWYKSGKVGFSGLVILSIFFAVRVAVALLNPSMLSFVGRFDAIISTAASFAFLITLYNLSGI